MEWFDVHIWGWGRSIILGTLNSLGAEDSGKEEMVYDKHEECSEIARIYCENSLVGTSIRHFIKSLKHLC